ncbi:MAG: hypothetical protein JWM73_454 [Solirubrobacterales bacterium]|nr:hypothetical protein [Solirubrobacterales bacterium]
MSRLLRAELLKLRTTRTFFAMVLSALLLSLLVAVLTAALSDHFTRADLDDLYTVDFSPLFMLLLGVMGMAGEWRHRTITATVLAAPDRLRLLAAKTLAYTVVSALVSLLVVTLTVAVASLILSSRDMPALPFSDIADLAWRMIVVAAFSGAFGVCVGAVVRNQVAAIVGLLILGFAIEPALIGLVIDVGKFGPIDGAPNGLIGTTFDDEGILAAGPAALVMLGWIAVGFSAAAVLLRRRDLT